MESIYYVINWACHRKCKHCYDDRFRPYVRDALDAKIAESKAAYPRIIENLPDTLLYQDPDVPDADGNPSQRIGRIVLAGGEVLVDPVREKVFYPILERLSEKYRHGRTGKIIIQTTGDLVTKPLIQDMLDRGVWLISISGMDDFHVGMEGDKKLPLMERLTAMFEEMGLAQVPLNTKARDWTQEDGPFFNFFGANPNAWIGEIWPRGRAWAYGLSRADMSVNFCARHSGGKSFLNHGWAGSEVAIEPDGKVYPCCLKTKRPLGSLAEERLIDILNSLKGHPVFEALNAGAPDRMGHSFGWSTDAFEAASQTVTPQGEPYQNLCIGCDRFFEDKLGPILDDIRSKRRSTLHNNSAQHSEM